MNTVYVFDMDGTLTPPRLPMTENFAGRFLMWQKNHISFLASGSDMKKVSEQLPYDVIGAFTGIYSSMGNLLSIQDTVVYRKEFPENVDLVAMLENFRKNTKYPYKLYPNYIENRIGMINFSVLGRDCPYEERLRYQKWDAENKERERIAAELIKNFPDYEVAVGGSISMDITMRDCGKGQIANDLRTRYPNAEIIFFGDRTFEGGNDYELAFELRQLPNTKVIQINNPEEVLSFLSA